MTYKIGKGKPPIQRQFQKGQSGNPEGARKHDELKKILKKMTSEEVRDAITDSLTSTEKELRESLALPNVSVLKSIIGKVVLKAADEGDYTLMNTLLTRVIGKT